MTDTIELRQTRASWINLCFTFQNTPEESRTGDGRERKIMFDAFQTSGTGPGNRLAHLDVCASGKRLTRYQRDTKMSDTKARIKNGVYPDAEATEESKFAPEGGAR